MSNRLPEKSAGAGAKWRNFLWLFHRVIAAAALAAGWAAAYNLFGGWLGGWGWPDAAARVGGAMLGLLVIFYPLQSYVVYFWLLSKKSPFLLDKYRGYGAAFRAKSREEKVKILVGAIKRGLRSRAGVPASPPQFPGAVELSDELLKLHSGMLVLLFIFLEIFLGITAVLTPMGLAMYAMDNVRSYLLDGEIEQTLGILLFVSGLIVSVYGSAVAALLLVNRAAKLYGAHLI